MFHKNFIVMQDAITKAKKAQRIAAIAAEQICDRRDRYHRLSEDCGSAEEDVNEELGCVRHLVDTAAAIHALSCGKYDRDSNKVLAGSPGTGGEQFGPGFPPRRL